MPLVAAALLAVSQPATALYQCSLDNPLSVPNTIDGLYLNFVTGATGSSGSTVAGWDFNPYNGGNTALTFFTPSQQSSLFGILATGMPGITADAQALRDGEGVWPNPTTGFYNRSITRATNFHTPGRRYIGIAFFNEAASIINYGWVKLISGDGTGNDAGFPVTIDSYCYEDSGQMIPVGLVPVELQHFSID